MTKLPYTQHWQFEN